MLAASLALLGFLLASITDTALTIFNERRMLVVDEANAIGTTYLRARYLDEPYSSESRELLREYVDTRLAALERDKFEASIARAGEFHQDLWSLVIDVAKINPMPTTALYVSSLNEVIDIHSKRVNAEQAVRIPPTLLLGLYLMSVLSMALIGIHDSYSGRRSIVSVLTMILILSMAFMLITGLERSSQGFMRVSQRPLILLQHQFGLNP